MQIEIEPGFFAPLRGAEETWAAMSMGRIAHVACLCCELPLQCISDAEYVLCPECKVVSPVFHNSGTAGGRGGVGLGLRADPNGGGGGGRRQTEHYHQQQSYQDYNEHGGGGGRYY